jgi:hypothetical protein
MDKLKAFWGDTGSIGDPVGAPFLSGLPASLFDVGLLWYPVRPLRRGDRAFPSWPWAGWVGPVW